MLGTAALSSTRLGSRLVGSRVARQTYSVALHSAPGATTVRQNRFKDAIAPGSTASKQIGLWTGISSTLVAEMLSHVSGFDWFVIDMEHSPNELKDVLLQVGGGQSPS